MKLACFDLGTNSFLCLTAELLSDGKFKELCDRSQVVRLGQGLYDSKPPKLSKEALVRAKQCLEEFTSEAKDFGAESFYAVATSAARDAENREELFSICKDLGIELEVISGQREAELTYGGSFFSEAPEDALVIDVGGGSTEFLLKDNEQAISKSLDMGAVRFTNKFLSSHPVPADELIKMETEILKELNSLPQMAKPGEIFAVAGTPTTLAAVMMELDFFDKEKIDGYQISRNELESLRNKLASLGLEERLSLKGMQRGREDVVVAGSSILLSCLDYFNKDSMTVSTRGVRYGLAYEKLGI